MSAESKGQDVAAADAAALLEKVIVGGDLSRLSSAERLAYYERVCTTVGLNPFTQPFAYLNLKGRGLVLYAQKGATDQLRSLHGISVDKVEVTYADDLVIVTVVVRGRDGRSDSDVGAVPLGRLQGEDRANAIMKAVTKAKRRATLSVCGLGMLDETEVESIPGAVTLAPDPSPPLPPLEQQAALVRLAAEMATESELGRVGEEIATESDDAGAHEAGQGALPGQGRPPKTATVEGIRRNELFTGIQAMAGVKLDTGERWKELARRYEMVEPARNADMTVGWLEELDRRMRRTRPTPAGGATRPRKHATDVTEQALAGWIASAPDDATLQQLAADVLAAQAAGTVTMAAAEALLEAVDARHEELHEAAIAQAVEEAVTVSPAAAAQGQESAEKEEGQEAKAATPG